METLNPATLMTAEERRRRFAHRKQQELRTEPPPAPLSDGRPVLGFDIDGVLSPLGEQFGGLGVGGFRWAGGGLGALHQFRPPQCVAHPLLPDWVAALDEAFECVWISSWADTCASFAANAGLECAVRWPHVSLVDSPDISAQSPSAAQKMELAPRWVPAGTPFAVVDDELAGDDESTDMIEAAQAMRADRAAPTLLLATPKHIGLCAESVEFLLAFAADPHHQRFRRDGPISIPECERRSGLSVWRGPVSRETPNPERLNGAAERQVTHRTIKAMWVECCDPFGMNYSWGNQQDGYFNRVAFSTEAVTWPSGRRWSPGLSCLNGLQAESHPGWPGSWLLASEQAAAALDVHAFTPLGEMPPNLLRPASLMARAFVKLLQALRAATLSCMPPWARKRAPSVEQVVLWVVRD